MIILNSVSKELGKGQFKQLVLEDITWVIPPLCRIVILGHRGSGKTTLLNVLAGLVIPTRGWVERWATVSVPGGLLRYGGTESPRKLILRISPIYQADPKEICEFVAQGAAVGHVMDVPIRRIPAILRRRLNIVLTYAFPCDYYLFDGGIRTGNEREFHDFCMRAFERRSRQAGTIAVTGAIRIAREFGDDVIGGVLHRRKLTLYKRLEDAISVFESLPEEASPHLYKQFVEPEAVQEEDELF